LNDGRAGHYKQSVALANILGSVRAGKGFAREDTVVETAQVRFRNLFARVLFDAGSSCGLSVHNLSFCFDKESYEALRGVYADYIISCGASLAGVNLCLKRELGAKSLVIMRPSLFSIKLFDLAAIPIHDDVKRAPNIISTRVP
jgi:mitochondrial fission protein ELM1